MNEIFPNLQPSSNIYECQVNGSNEANATIYGGCATIQVVLR